MNRIETRADATAMAMPSEGVVVYALPDKAGGVYTVANNLLSFRRADRNRYIGLLTHNTRSLDTRSEAALPVDRIVIVEHSLPYENLYSAMRRVRRAIPNGRGALVANDWLELATASTYDLGKAVINITHGDYAYYYDLAVRHAGAIDLFIAHTRRIHETLCALLPERVGDIRYIRYGVRIPDVVRNVSDGPLRVLYVGRFDDNKGTHDLPAIAAQAQAAGADTRWTLIGEGPALGAAKAAWSHDVPAVWRGQLSAADTLHAYGIHDVLVLPSRNEGLPAVLLEAGAAGLVPIVSDLPSGIPEVVENDRTGYRIAVGDTSAFAQRIVELDQDRSLLERLSGEVRARIAGEYDIVKQAPAYQSAIESAIELEGGVRRRVGPGTGSRLDQWWIPNPLVRAIRLQRSH